LSNNRLPTVHFAFIWLNSILLFVFFSGQIVLSSAEISDESSAAYTYEQLKERLTELRDEHHQTKSYETLVSLFFDGKHLSETLTQVFYNDHPPLFRFRTIRKLLSDKISSEAMMRLGEAQDLQGWVALDILSTYKPHFNQDTLSFYLTTPPEERDDGVINLLKQPKFDLSNALEPLPHSAYLNFFNIFSWDEDQGHYHLNMEGAVRSHPWEVESRIEVNPEENQKVTYNNLRVIRDYPQKLTRLTIGETQSFHPRILSSDRIQGIKYSTEYELQPRLVTEPISEYSFLLQRDSTVEVWVNGEHIETLRLQAGPYDILNFPLRIGLNKVVLKITDDLGREQVLSFDPIKGPNLLAPGKSEFAYSLGKRGNGNHYGGKGIFSTFYRHGINDTITASGEFRVDGDHLGAGLGCDFACRWFSGGFNVGATKTDFGTGTATQLLLSRHFKWMSVSFRSDFNSRKFLIQSQDLENTRIRSVQELAVTVPRLGDYGSLRLYLSRIRRWAGDDEYRKELQWSYTLNERWSFRLTTGQYNLTNDDKGDDWILRGQVTYNFFGDKFRHRHDLQVSKDRQSLYSMVGGNPSKRHGDWMISHNHVKQDDSDTTDSLRGFYRYRHHRFQTYYTAEVGDFGDDNDFKQILNIDTSIAYAGGEWAFGQPIMNSFALVHPHTDLGKTEIKATYADFNARGSDEMAAVIPNLRPYHPQIITVESSSDTVALNQPPYLVFPYHHSGYLLKVENTEGDGGSAGASGMLLDWKGNPVPYQALFIINTSEEGVRPFVSFTNRSGYFIVNGLTPGILYRIKIGKEGELEDNPDQPIYEFTLSNDTLTTEQINLGKLMPINSEQFLQVEIEKEEKPIRKAVKKVIQIVEEKKQEEKKKQKQKPQTAFSSRTMLPQTSYRFYPLEQCQQPPVEPPEITKTKTKSLTRYLSKFANRRKRETSLRNRLRWKQLSPTQWQRTCSADYWKIPKGLPPKIIKINTSEGAAYAPIPLSWMKMIASFAVFDALQLPLKVIYEPKTHLQKAQVLVQNTQRLKKSRRSPYLWKTLQEDAKRAVSIHPHLQKRMTLLRAIPSVQFTQTDHNQKMLRLQ